MHFAAKPPVFSKFVRDGAGGIMTDGVSFHIYGKRPSAQQQRTAARVRAELADPVAATKAKEQLSPPAAPPAKKAKQDDVDDGGRSASCGFTGIVTLEDAIAKGIVDAEFFNDRPVYNVDPGQRYAVSGSVVFNWSVHSFVRVSTRDFYRQTGRDKVQQDGARVAERLGGASTRCRVAAHADPSLR